MLLFAHIIKQVGVDAVHNWCISARLKYSVCPPAQNDKIADAKGSRYSHNHLYQRRCQGKIVSTFSGG